jgi:hypothetical protein
MLSCFLPRSVQAGLPEHAYRSMAASTKATCSALRESQTAAPDCPQKRAPCTAKVQNLEILSRKPMMISHPLRSRSQSTQRQQFLFVGRYRQTKTFSSTGAFIAEGMRLMENRYLPRFSISIDLPLSSLRSPRSLRETSFYLVADMLRCDLL